MSGPTIQVYSRPACVQCDATRRRLARRGAPFTELALDDHPDAVTLAREAGYTSAPVVVVLTSLGLVADVWGGFQPDRIDAWAARMIGGGQQ